MAKVQSKASTSQIFSENLFADSVSFTLSHFVNVSKMAVMGEWEIFSRNGESGPPHLMCYFT